MSLKAPDDRSGRSRSKSPGRTRSRSRDERAPEPPRAPSPPSSKSYGSSRKASRFEDDVTPTYEMRSPASAGAERSNSFRQGSAPAAPYPTGGMPYPGEAGGLMPEMPEDPVVDYGLAYGETAPVISSRQNSYSDPYSPQVPYSPQSARNPYPADPPASTETPTYRYNAEALDNTSRSSSYSYQYAQPPDKITYSSRPQPGGDGFTYTQSPQDQYAQLPRDYSSKTSERSARFADVAPENDKRDLKSSGSKKTRLSVDTRSGDGLQAERSPGLTPRMDRLSVSGNRPNMSGGMPPPSPMLEAYHGTYQSISPMPMAMRPDDDSELDDLEPLSPIMARNSSRANDKLAQEATKAREKKRVQLYNPDDDAKTLSQALSKQNIDTETICDTLPTTSHDRIMELRKEYKKQVKIQGKGVNLPKHLKTKLSGNFGKVAYVTALGKWESEGYWANFWYQSHSSRRELLIESLMGRSNNDIWQIKDEFKDKRYSDDLVKCMEKELKMDKFRTAVLMVLEERRQEEQDVYPIEYRNRDVDTLHKAMTAKQGGESTMLEVIVRRSDAHLREVMKTYEKLYQENFPRAALKKSSNLVVCIVQVQAYTLS